jgi:hypothetical protein
MTVAAFMASSRLGAQTALVVAAVGASASLTPLVAQDGLFPARSAVVSPVFERWSFGSGLRQPSSAGAGSVELQSASAWSIPIAASVGVSERWTLDVSTSYANGTVRLRAADPETGADDYTLSGFTDVRTRLTGRIVGDAVVATVGANLPSGTTSLDPSEFAALRVLAAPALAMQTPALGTGFGATAGVVLARQLGGWGWAVGASYELRRTYTPIAFATEAPSPDVDPGDALHLSLGADGLVGQSGMTVALSTDLFTDDKFEPRAATLGSAVADQAVTTHLGPIITLDWQLRVAAPQLRELTVYAVDRYRTPYERGGKRVDQSGGNYLDAGIRAVFPASPSTGVSSTVNVRHQTGLKSDSTLATAATAGVGVTVGLVRSFGGGYSLQPFVRGDYAKIKSADASATGTGFAVGVALGRRF